MAELRHLLWIVIMSLSVSWYQELTVLGGHGRFHAYYLVQLAPQQNQSHHVSSEDFQPCLAIIHLDVGAGERMTSVWTLRGPTLRQGTIPGTVSLNTKLVNYHHHYQCLNSLRSGIYHLDCILIELLTMRCHLNSSATFYRAGGILQRTDMRADSWLGKNRIRTTKALKPLQHLQKLQFA